MATLERGGRRRNKGQSQHPKKREGRDQDIRNRGWSSHKKNYLKKEGIGELGGRNHPTTPLPPKA
jgi:hypothetical protein